MKRLSVSSARVLSGFFKCYILRALYKFQKPVFGQICGLQISSPIGTFLRGPSQNKGFNFDETSLSGVFSFLNLVFGVISKNSSPRPGSQEPCKGDAHSRYVSVGDQSELTFCRRQGGGRGD